ncbi:DUF2798 domain-containing protein [Falsirhodobacter sp. alg1]|uniref:DUF2798 domain-containing protein n=1 Tax=Falsirhodobacter sp. alg1 TaxID=1472418 RepID=UPI0005ED6B47|nr:DUF2798 domain-containing protein [Falsirhodobacter sp. alg1]
MIPERYFSTIYGLILSGLMSFILSAATVVRLDGITNSFVPEWLVGSVCSWSLAFPSVLMLAPVVRRLVRWLTA